MASVAQQEAVQHIGEVNRRIGPPPCAPAEAHRALCGEAQSCCTADVAGPRASYQRDLVALPEDGVAIDGGTCLYGDARELRYGWEERLSRSTPSTEGPSTPYSDPLFVRRKDEYAICV